MKRADTSPAASTRSAVVSPCGRYRYRLERRWGAERPAVAFVMLNPSTADHRHDDATIRRCVGFARRWGFDGLIVVNLFALRATDPTVLFDAVAAGVDPVGLDNAAHVQAVASEHRVVLAWGAGAVAVAGPGHPSRVVDDLAAAGAALFCLGRCRDGAPRHPLYVPASTALSPWSDR